MSLSTRTWRDFEVIDDIRIKILVVKIDINASPSGGARKGKAKLVDFESQKFTVDFTIRAEVHACTATYAIERGVTDRNPIRVATLERVAVLFVLDRFAGGGSSFVVSVPTDDGDVNKSLKA